MPFGTLQEERHSKCKLIIIINSFYTPAELQRIKWEEKIRKKKKKRVTFTILTILLFSCFFFFSLFIDISVRWKILFIRKPEN